jgi:hypothetical protein
VIKGYQKQSSALSYNNQFPFECRERL